MSDTEKVEWLATEMMGEEWKRENTYWNRLRVDCGYGHEHVNWSPLYDWNHWRQVEEKVMEQDDKAGTHLLPDMMMLCGGRQSTTPDLAEYIGFMAFNYIKSDLPTRARALYLAYQSLQ